MGLARAPDGAWRIASESYVWQGAPHFERPVGADELVARLDEADVRGGVVLSNAYYFDSVRPEPVSDAYAKVQAENDWTGAEVAKHPDRLVGFCSFNPLKDYALAELQRCASSGRFRGVKLHLNAAQAKFSDPASVEKLRRVFAAANGKRLAIIVHVRPGAEYGAAEAETFVGRVLPAAPDVPVQIAHLWGGESYSSEALKVYADAVAARKKGTRNLYFDLSGVTQYGAQEDLTSIADTARRIGLDRMLFGSDAPVREAIDAARDKLPFTDAELRQIAGNVAPYLRTP